MRVAFDSQIFRLQETGGISKYFVKLVQHLREADPKNSYIIFGNITANRHLIDSGLKYSGINSKSALRKLVKNRFYDISKTFGPALESVLFSLNGIDIIHYTYYGYQYLKPGREKKVITIHDLIYEKFPSEFPDAAELLALKKKSIEDADHIICISENTKNDLVNYYNVDRKKTSVIYHGVDIIPSQTLKRLNYDYILFVGKRGGYKNFEKTLAAYSQSSLKGKFKLLCFGGGNFTKKETELIKINYLDDNVVYLEGSDDRLNNIYQHAFCLVYPSLYEGFGLPVLEAMANKCPVICSNGSSLPEIAGEAAILVDTSSVPELIRAMESLYNDAEFRNSLIRKGEANVKLFSWEATASKTRRVYFDLLNEANGK
jgi:glycosyltransferase involved in cell wall biosynthesis